jgi:ABC-type multidrug transport system fused ATPase/permease subunit
MFVRSLTVILLSCVLLIYISAELTAILFGAIIPIVIFGVCAANKMRGIQREIQKEKGEMNKVSEESFSNVRVVKAFANESHEIERFKAANDKVYGRGVIKAIWSGAISFVIQMLLFGSMAAIVWHAGSLVETSEETVHPFLRPNINNEGKVSIGEISTFLFYMTTLLFNFAIMGFMLANAAGLLGASDRVHEFVEVVPAIPHKGGRKLEGDIKGIVEFKNVKFRYPTKPEI